MDVFLTGGTGYLGSRILDGLLRAGHQVRLLYRSPEKVPPANPRVLPVRGDLSRPEALRDAIAGVDAICHTAAMVKSWVPDPSRMHAVNVTAVETLTEVARSLGIPKMIYTSSFMALGPSGAQPITERSVTERDHFHNLYEKTKYLGDQAARAAQARGAPVVILYPSVIFGPGETTDGNLVAKILADLIRGRLPGRMGNGSALWNYAFVEDVVAGHLLALDSAQPGQRFILGGENVSMDGFLDISAELSGVAAPTRRIPGSVARSLAFVMELGARISGRQPALTREVVGIYENSWAYSSAAAESELGYRPTPFREALALTIDWVRETVIGGTR